MNCFLNTYVKGANKSPECATAVCGHDAGCLAVPGVSGGYICVCDYHGDVKEALDKPCRKLEGNQQNHLSILIYYCYCLLLYLCKLVLVIEIGRRQLPTKSSLKTKVETGHHHKASITHHQHHTPPPPQLAHADATSVGQGVNNVQQAGHYWLLVMSGILIVVVVLIIISVFICLLKLRKKNRQQRESEETEPIVSYTTEHRSPSLQNCPRDDTGSGVTSINNRGYISIDHGERERESTSSIHGKVAAPISAMKITAAKIRNSERFHFF